MSDTFAKNMSFKFKFQIISNIAFKFRYKSLWSSSVGEPRRRSLLQIYNNNNNNGIYIALIHRWSKRLNI